MWWRKAIRGWQRRSRLKLSGGSQRKAAGIIPRQTPFLGDRHTLDHVNQSPGCFAQVQCAPITRHEAVGNVLKHASAKQVKIGMRIDGPVLEVQVEDNGVGFDTSKRATVGHDGLGNMTRRMKEAGGSVDVVSAIGNGTCVTFRVPLG